MTRSLLCVLVLGFVSIGSVSGAPALEDGVVCFISVSGAPPEYTREYEGLAVVARGTIRVGDLTIRAAGLTPTQLAGAIERRLREEKIYTKPQVLLNIPIVDSTVTIGGAVREPGRHIFIRGMRLSSVLDVAGGTNGTGNGRIFLVRDGKGRAFTLKGIRKDPSKDLKLCPGDYIEFGGEF
jgi:protein involved in polysaccharide export with SLBB domain